MRVLVAAASRHESTAEIAAQIGRVLAAAGLDVDLRHAGAVPEVAGYDAAIIGSAVYYGRWMRTAYDLVGRQEEALRRIPLWLFSVGALVDDAPAAPAPPLVAELVARTGARGHRAFRGVLAAERLAWHERLAVSLVRARYGDFRDWTAVREWAGTIAHALVPGRAPSPERVRSTHP